MVPLGNPLGDRESQARAARVTVPRIVGAIKPLEDMWQCGVRNADAGVANGQCGARQYRWPTETVMRPPAGVYFTALSTSSNKSRRSAGSLACTNTGSSGRSVEICNWRASASTCPCSQMSRTSGVNSRFSSGSAGRPASARARSKQVFHQAASPFRFRHDFAQSLAILSQATGRAAA